MVVLGEVFFAAGEVAVEADDAAAGGFDPDAAEEAAAGVVGEGDDVENGGGDGAEEVLTNEVEGYSARGRRSSNP